MFGRHAASAFQHGLRQVPFGRHDIANDLFESEVAFKLVWRKHFHYGEISIEDGINRRNAFRQRRMRGEKSKPRIVV